MRFDAINPGPALTSVELDAYCGKHGLVLPASLRRQLLDQNGGAPSADPLVPLPDAAPRVGEFRTIRIRDGVITGLTGNRYCGPTAGNWIDAGYGA